MSEPVERVVLALDATDETRTTIDLAVRLAAHAKLRLHAVFVEDEDLLSAAGLPIAREVIAGTGASSLTAEQAELHQRAVAARAQEDIRAAASQHALEHSFEIVRGGAETALAAASERDLVVAGALARPVAGVFRARSRWLTIVDRTPGPFLLARQESGRARGVVALLREQNEAASRLLQLAAAIAEAGGVGLTALYPASRGAADDFRQWIGKQIGPTARRPRIEVAPSEPAELHTRLAELQCGLLAIGGEAVGGDPERVRELGERLGCDVLIVR